MEKGAAQKTEKGAAQESSPKPAAGGSPEELVAAVERSARRIEAVSDAVTTYLDEARERIQAEVDELQATLARVRDGAAAEPAINRDPSSQGARLLATQLVSTGSDREEIEKRLREDFLIADPAEILDSIVGVSRP